MKKVFIVHGFRSSPNEGWRSWLMGELNKADIYACALPMPNPWKPKKEEWIETISNSIKEPNEDIFLVGHSLGVPAILQYLSSLPEGTRLGGAVLVSGPIEKIKTEDLDSKLRDIDNFFDPNFDFQRIKDSCKSFFVVHGDDDDKVPLKHGQALADKLGCEISIVKNGKHLAGRDGFSELPQVLSALEQIMQ